MSDEDQAPFIRVVVGDKLRDCDPRTDELRRIKTVLAVGKTDVTVKGDYGGAVQTTLSRLRIHNKPTKKTGYFLMPKA